MSLSFGSSSLFLASLPPSFGVLVAAFLFSSKTGHKIIKANLVASLAVAVGLAAASSMNPILSPPFDSPTFGALYLAALGIPANIAQMVLLHLLNKSWKTRNLSLAMMPTAFFSFNLLNFAGFLATHSANQLYTYLSSLGFLPALTFAGVTSGTISKKMTVQPSISVPKITVTGSSLVHQGQDQTIKVVTESAGQPNNMASINATVAKPGGKNESLKLSWVSRGLYKAFYRVGAPGSYTVRVTAIGKDHSTADKSFSFNVQAPPPRYPPPSTTPSRPPPTSPAPPSRGPLPQSPYPPLQRPTISSVTPTLPKLDSWDPRVWVNQEVHGYKIKEYLATGLTGYVLRASFEHGGTEMAIKIPILKTATGTSALDETMSEATRLLELSEQSKYVVQLRGILVDRLNVQEIVKGDTALYLRSPPAIVMELMKGGAAKKLLEDPSYDSVYYSEKWGDIVMLLGYMIATGLETIHKAGFVHLDVKPQNILFNVKPPFTGWEVLDQMRSGVLVPKLADLGSAVRIGGKVTQFTSEYAPIEQVQGSGVAPAMDIYALGATIYNMLTKTPANSKKLIEAMNNMTRNPGSSSAANDLRAAWNSFTPDFTKVERVRSAVPSLKKMLAKDPEQRPSAESVASSLRNL